MLTQGDSAERERSARSVTICLELLMKRKGLMDGPRRVYRLGGVVRIKSGPFAEFMGRVEGINQSKSLLKVKLEIFGRDTPLKVSFSDAEKVKLPPLGKSGSGRS
jgi:hypothetical protein